MVKARLNALGEKLDLYLITANELIRAAIRHESGVRHFEHCVFRDLRREDEKTRRREDGKTRRRQDEKTRRRRGWKKIIDELQLQGWLRHEHDT